jgi:hypothetical protein
MAVVRRCFLGGNRSPMAGDDRGRALEHWEREESQMCDRIKGRENRVVELTEGAAMAAAVPNSVVAAVLRRPMVYER